MKLKQAIIVILAAAAIFAASFVSVKAITGIHSNNLCTAACKR